MTTRHVSTFVAIIALVVIAGCSGLRPRFDDKLRFIPKRHVQSLDGTWQIAEGKMDAVPTAFDRTVPVPGLASLATPPFADPPGPKVANRSQVPQKDPHRDAFWYRRVFNVEEPLPAVSLIKVRKTMFGTRVILNGKLLGDHAPSFTPGFFDAKSALKPGENELLIRVGADRDAVGANIPSGFDFEKERYIPGIFDSVELILSGNPHFIEVQAIPNISNRTVLVHAVLRNDGEPTQAALMFKVVAAKSGKFAAAITGDPVTFGKGENKTFDFQIPIADCHLWSPEDPFLYRLIVSSGADDYQTRFGMRELRFKPGTNGQPGRAWLNGRPYFLRGSNFTLYRFFEDPDCGNLPWDGDWVRLLHQRVKEMHWNCLRYCIGFPPERWYDIADEMGILIQDEFPLWSGHPVKRDELSVEYAEWMRERWNHPCVAIWDAQNETGTAETGAALSNVRALDLSNRPWDNGWSPAQSDTDTHESHPYQFYDAHATLSQALANKDGDPSWGSPVPNSNHNATVINEYGWLWLNRDGSPTTLTRDLYRNLLGTNSTAAQRRHLYATYLAATTEYWRTHRQAAAVMHFTTLGYSRPDGQTSDHWLDVRKLEWEPEFLKSVRDAFSPVGLMVDFANSTVLSGQTNDVPVVLINDLEKPWKGRVTLRLRGADHKIISEQSQDCSLEPFGKTTATFTLLWPEAFGSGALEAELRDAGNHPVRSVREIEIASPRSLGLAYHKNVTASSTFEKSYLPQYAVDGNPGTYWSSTFSDPAWLAVDLGGVFKISRVRITWETAYSSSFTIQTSLDGQTWTDASQIIDGKGGVSEIPLPAIEARHVRIYATKRGTQWGHAIRELQVFE